MLFLQDKIYLLKGKVQHYAWGGFDYMPHWLNIENNERKPYAEYWMGAHPSAPSEIETEHGSMQLYDSIKKNPEELIGKKVYDVFGELPYLFKVQDVHEMLSIQVHPSKTEAAKGFEAEDAAGISINAPYRNYKDKNHKPEVTVALSEFWLLHGFLQKEKLLQTLNDIPAFQNLRKIFEQEDYKGLYKHVMEMPQQEVNNMLKPLVALELERKNNNLLDKSQPGWWVAKYYAGDKKINDIDRGIFSIYFFNIVKINPGEAVFQAAGVPHAYLEGQNVELMANSDNVLRGGLTPKHIDIPELLKHISFEGIEPNIMRGEWLPNGEKNYPCPVSDFGINVINLTGNNKIAAASASLEIIVVLNGEIFIEGTGKILAVKKGQAVAILPLEQYSITSPNGGLAYKAYIPQG
ncbi:MAG: mannose-6-phosphate isomerase, class I [Chitinophagaceae bacterium]|jgi:mannose-6-phosphate isomerase|nr:mannose-6-phosphate isomerase, class I [Chitinophagaceae bacterium]